MVSRDSPTAIFEHGDESKLLLDLIVTSYLVGSLGSVQLVQYKSLQ